MDGRYEIRNGKLTWLRGDTLMGEMGKNLIIPLLKKQLGKRITILGRTIIKGILQDVRRNSGRELTITVSGKEIVVKEENCSQYFLLSD